MENNWKEGETWNLCQSFEVNNLIIVASQDQNSCQKTQLAKMQQAQKNYLAWVCLVTHFQLDEMASLTSWFLETKLSIKNDFFG